MTVSYLQPYLGVADRFVHVQRKYEEMAGGETSLIFVMGIDWIKRSTCGSSSDIECFDCSFV